MRAHILRFAITGLLTALCFTGPVVHAQVGIGTTTPDASAQLELQTTTRGFLPPRLTDAEMNAIASPANGLVVFNTDQAQLYYYDAGAVLWKAVAGVGGGAGWELGGNAITDPLTEWLGTTSTHPLAFRTDGQERMRIDENGTVGIGTITPRGQFNIHRAGQLDVFISSDEFTNKAASLILFRTNGGSDVLAGDNLGALKFGGQGISTLIGASINAMAAENFTPGASGSNMIFSTTGIGSFSPSERMRIMENGNIGINVAAPAARLQVYEDSNDPAVLIGNSSGPGMRIEASGGVVGMALDAYLFTNPGDGGRGINVLVEGGGNNYGQRIEVSSTSVGADAVGLLVSSAGDANGDNAVAAVFSNGNVGIGTMLPAYRFDVDVNAAANYVARFRNTAEGAGVLIQRQASTVGGNPALRIENNNGDANDLISGDATNTGNLLNLSLNGTAAFTVGNDGNLALLRGVGYSWPAAQGGASTVLTNDGSGGLTWAAAGGSDNLGDHTATQTLDLNGHAIISVGNIGIGSGTEFYVANDGNITNIRSVSYGWPSSQGGAGTVLTNNGGGGLSWSTPAGDNWGSQTVATTGNFTGDGTTGNELELSTTGAIAGTYGSAFNVPQLSVDAHGRITGVSDVAISFPPGDNWGSQTAATTGIITGNGTTGNEIGLANGSVAGHAPYWDGSAWQIGANPTQWEENAGNVYRNTGFVGIGTSTPSRHLHIQANDGGAGLALFNNSGTGHAGWFQRTNSTATDALMYFNIADNTDAGAVIHANTVGTGNLAEFKLNGNNRLVIANDGNLAMVRNVAYTWPAANAGGVLSNDGAGNLTWGAAPGDNLGNHIATTQIQSTLGSAAAPSVSFSGDLNTGIYSPGADQISFAIAGTQRVSINANGNVGIGIGSASHPLEVLTATGTFAGRFSTTNTGVGSAAVRGDHSAGGGFTTYGVHGTTGSTSINGAGVYGSSTTLAVGVKGQNSANSSGATGVLGVHTAGGLMPSVYGVQGTVSSTSPLAAGVYGNTTTAGTGVLGASTGTGMGVHGTSSGGHGVRGESNAATGTNYGVFGTSASTDALAAGVYGGTTTSGSAVLGQSSANQANAAGVRGQHTTAIATLTYGVYGSTASTNADAAGVYGTAPGTGWAVDAAGKLRATGNVTFSGLNTVGTIGTEQFLVANPATGLLSRYTGALPGDNWGSQTATTSGVVTGDGVGNPLRLADGTAANQVPVWDGSAWSIAAAPGDGWGTDVATANGMLTGDGTSGDPLRLVNGGGVGDVPVWNGASWAAGPAPTAANVWLNGGNSFGAVGTLGTNDPFGLNFETNGVTRIGVDGGGNVGIAVAPAANTRLSLQTAVNTYGINIVNSNTVSNTTGLVGFTSGSSPNTTFGVWGVTNSTSTNSAGVYGSTTSAASGIVAQNEGSGSSFRSLAQNVRASSYTNAVISNTSTSATAGITKTGLDIQSTGAWTGAGAINTGLNVNVSGGATNYAALFNGGNVGVGTAAPAAMLHTVGTVRHVSLGVSGSLVGHNLAAINTTTGEMVEFTGTLPGDNLGNHTATQDLNLNGNDITSSGSIVLHSGGTDVLQLIGGAATIQAMNGQFRGLSGTAVSSPAYAFATSTGTGISNPTVNEMTLVANGTEVARVTSTGIGIGTNSPLATLHTIGNVRMESLGATATLTGYQLAALNTTTGAFERFTGTLPGDDLGNHTATTQVQGTVGSAGAPSYTFAGMLSTGIYSPFADAVGISTAGTERMRVAANGNVGIGTNPANAARLVVETGGMTDPGLLVRSGSTSGAHVAVARNGGPVGRFGVAGALAEFSDLAAAGDIVVSAQPSAGSNNLILAARTAAGNIIFGNGATDIERMRIASGGNIGVGTTNPLAQLHTTGTVRLANYASGANGAIVRTSSTGDVSITNFSGSATDVLRGDGTFGATPGGLPAGANTNTLYHNGTNWVVAPNVATDGGNVGIGSAAASNQRLTIGAGTGTGILVTASGAASAGILVAHSGGGSAIRSTNSGSGFAMELDQTGSGDVLRFNKNGLSVFQINGNGNVGIGLQTPGAQLHTTGSVRLAGIATTGTFTDVTDDFLVVNGVGDVQRYTGTLPGDNLGNHIATTQIQSTAGTAAAPGYSFVGDLNTGVFAPTADQYAISTAGTERMRVDANGNVGIGTATPTHRLNVTSTDNATSGTLLSAGSFSLIHTTGAGDASNGIPLRNTLSINGSNAATGTFTGFSNGVTNGNLANTSFVNGGITTVSLTGANTSSVFGQTGDIQLSGTATFGSARGVRGSLTNNSTAASTTMYGVEGTLSQFGSGSLNTFSGLYSSMLVSAGTVSNGYGVLVNGFSGAGTVTNYTGVSIADITDGPTYYAIRFSEPSQPFVVTGAGNVGVATTNPVWPLDINGGANTSQQYYINSNRALAMYGGFTNIQVGTNAGNNTMSGTNNTLVGSAAGNPLTTGADNTLVGRNAAPSITTGSRNTVVGSQAASILLGGIDNTFIGYDAGSNGTGPTGSIALGSGARVTGNNQMVVGGNTLAINNVYFGNGVTSGVPGNIAINATGGAGANIAGATLTLAGGIGTGSAFGGDIRFATTSAGAPSAVPNTLQNRMTITGAGNVGVGTVAPTATLHLGAGTFRLPVGGTVDEITTTISAASTNSQLPTAASVWNAVSAGPNQWSTDGTNVWRISGNVGIGSAAPVERLHVAGRAYIQHSSTQDGAVYAFNQLTFTASSMLARQGGTFVAESNTAAEFKIGVQGVAKGNAGGLRGIMGWAQGTTTDDSYGVQGINQVSGAGNHMALYGEATGGGAGGVNYGVYGVATGGSTNWAGFFQGRGYFAENVGIGTSIPSALLHTVHTTGAAASPAQRTDYTYSGAAGINAAHQINIMGTGASTGAIHGIYMTGSNSGTGATVGGGFYITGNGNQAAAVEASVGGTASTKSGFYGFVNGASATNRGAYLTVSGATTANYGSDVSVTGPATDNYGYYANVIGGTDNWAFYGAAGNNYYAGNTAMGLNTAAAFRLNIHEASSGTETLGLLIRNASTNPGTATGLRIANTTNADGSAAYYDIVNTRLAGLATLDFRQNATSTMYFDGSRNVGIGTNTPGYRLDVVSPTFQALRLNTTSTTDRSISMKFVNNNVTPQEWEIGVGGAGNGLGFTTGQMYIYNNAAGVSDLLIRTAGNVGIGNAITAPDEKLEVVGSRIMVRNPGNVTLDGSYIAGVSFNDQQANSQALISVNRDGTSSSAADVGTSLRFWTTPDGSGSWTQKMIIEGGGNVGIGTGAPTYLLHATRNFAGSIVQFANLNNTTTADVLRLQGGSNTTAGAWLAELRRQDGTLIGSISQNSATTVAYNTTSDSRLKSVIGESRLGLQELMQIQIMDYTYKSDSSQKVMTGVLAQQLHSVFPQSVSVPNPERGDDPSQNPWMVDYGSLTPLIIRAVQQQQAQIDELRNNGAVAHSATGVGVTPQQFATLNQQVQGLDTNVVALQTEVAQLREMLAQQQQAIASLQAALAGR